MLLNIVLSLNVRAVWPPFNLPAMRMDGPLLCHTLLEVSRGRQANPPAPHLNWSSALLVILGQMLFDVLLLVFHRHGAEFGFELEFSTLAQHGVFGF